LKALRIAFISPFSPLKGGIARFSGQLMDALRQSGYDVIPFGYRKLFPAVFFSQPRFGGEHPETSCSDIGEEPILVLYNPFSWVSAVRRLGQLKPDILLIAYWTGFLAPLCFMLRRMTGIKTVILLHNFSSHESFGIDPFFKRLVKFSADGFLTLSREVATELAESRCAVPVSEQFHPVYDHRHELTVLRDDARQELGLEPETPLLLFFGYVRRYKGLDLLLQAMPGILRVDERVRLMVAGEFYEPLEGYRGMIDRLGIAGSVDLYPGYATEERTSLLFAAADAVVLPYRSASQSGVVSLAYGYGVPVIVTAVGGLAGMVEPRQTGWIAAEPSVDALVEVVGRFLGERGDVDTSAAIRSYCQKASWLVLAERTGRFLETILHT
jgi:glycosyltransferase involved in cell wall biosynthesis